MWSRNKIILISAILSLIACATAKEPIKTNSSEIRILFSSENDPPEFVLPNGETGRGWENYELAVENYLNFQQKTSLELTFEMKKVEFENGYSGSFDQTSGALYKKLPYVDFGISFNVYSKKTVGASCFQAAGPAANIRLTKASKGGDKTPFVDLHVVLFKSNGKTCVGLYDSGKIIGFCKVFCSPSKTGIKNAIYSAAISAGVAAGIATLFAEVGAPLVVGALAL